MNANVIYIDIMKMKMEMKMKMCVCACMRVHALQVKSGIIYTPGHHFHINENWQWIFTNKHDSVNFDRKTGWLFGYRLFFKKKRMIEFFQKQMAITKQRSKIASPLGHWKAMEMKIGTIPWKWTVFKLWAKGGKIKI